MSDETPLTAHALPTTRTSTHELIHDRLLHWLREEAHLNIDSIGYDDCIFEIGLDSLGSAWLAAEMEREFGIRLNPDEILDCQTINQLADYVERQRG